MRHGFRWVLVAGGVAILSLFAGLLVSNYVGGELRIERRIERLHGLDDPRSMHQLGLRARSPASGWLR